MTSWVRHSTRCNKRPTGCVAGIVFFVESDAVVSSRTRNCVDTTGRALARIVNMLLVLLTATSALLVPNVPLRPTSALRSPRVTMGLFDAFMESPEEKARKEALKEREYQEQLAMLARRRNPEAQAAYFAEVEEKRVKVAQADAELKALQRGANDGSDTLGDWMQMKKEGKVVASEQERDKDSKVLGSKDGLIAERIDEKLPYIDSGYVDENAPSFELPEMPDLGKAFGKLFGGDK